MSVSDADRRRRNFAARVSLLFGAIFVVAGINLPYLPVWLDWRGLDPREIAIITAAPLIVRVVVTPAIAFAADRAGDHRRFLIVLAWCGLAALLALSQSTGFWSILICSLAFALAWTTIMPLTETVALSGVKAAGLDYGRMRLWGSLSFIAATVCGGWVVGYYGAASAIWLVVAGGALTTLAAHALAQPIGLGRLKTATTAPRLHFSEALALLRSRLFLIFLLATGTTQAAHAMFYTFGTLHWASQGLSADWSGALWAIGVIAEILLFSFSATLMRRVGSGAADRGRSGRGGSPLAGHGVRSAAGVARGAAGAARAHVRRRTYRGNALHRRRPCRRARQARRKHFTHLSQAASPWAPRC